MNSRVISYGKCKVCDTRTDDFELLLNDGICESCLQDSIVGEETIDQWLDNVEDNDNA